MLHSFPANEYHEAEALSSVESISKLTLSILSLEPVSSTFVPEAKEEMLDLKSAMPTQGSYVMPLKRGPICNDGSDFHINISTGECLDQLRCEGMTTVSD